MGSYCRFRSVEWRRYFSVMSCRRFLKSCPVILGPELPSVKTLTSQEHLNQIPPDLHILMPQQTTVNPLKSMFYGQERVRRLLCDFWTLLTCWNEIKAVYHWQNLTFTIQCSKMVDLFQYVIVWALRPAWWGSSTRAYNWERNCLSLKRNPLPSYIYL